MLAFQKQSRRECNGASAPKYESTWGSAEFKKYFSTLKDLSEKKMFILLGGRQRGTKGVNA